MAQAQRSLTVKKSQHWFWIEPHSQLSRKFCLSAKSEKEATIQCSEHYCTKPPSIGDSGKMFQEGDGFGLPDPMGLDQFDLGILQVSRASGASFSGASSTPPWLTPAVSRPGPCLTTLCALLFNPTLVITWGHF